ncbi:MAG: hypothetical protein AAF388_16765 [Bacteroidota bacterium]
MIRKVIYSILLIVLFSCGPPTYDGLYLEIKPKDYNGQIVERGRDENNWGLRYVKLNSAQKSILIDVFFCHYDMWQIAEVGDSLSKVSGSLEYQLFKEDTVLYFYPDCVEDKDIGVVKNPNWQKRAKEL